MIHKQLLLVLVFSGYASSVFSHDTSSPDLNESPLTIPSEVLEKVTISKEEAYYIRMECKQFAIDDEIESEFVDDYIEVCAYELTQAVKTAKYKHQMKRPAEKPTNNDKSGTPQPL